MQDCSNSTAKALELLQSCTKPSIGYTANLSFLFCYGAYQQNMWPLPQSTAWEKSVAVLFVLGSRNVGERGFSDSGSFTAWPQPGWGHHLMWGLLSTKACREGEYIISFDTRVCRGRLHYLIWQKGCRGRIHYFTYQKGLQRKNTLFHLDRGLYRDNTLFQLT